MVLAFWSAERESIAFLQVEDGRVSSGDICAVADFGCPDLRPASWLASGALP